jgi:hypothetical protein
MRRYVVVNMLLAGLILFVVVGCIPDLTDEPSINQCAEEYQDVSEEDFERLTASCERLSVINSSRVPEGATSATYEKVTRIDAVDVSQTDLEVIHAPELTRLDEITCFDNDSFTQLDAPNLTQVGGEGADSLFVGFDVEDCTAWTTIELASIEMMEGGLSLRIEETPPSGSMTVRFDSLEYLEGTLTIQLGERASDMEIFLEFPELVEIDGWLKIETGSRSTNTQRIHADFGALETVIGHIWLPSFERLASFDFGSVAYCESVRVGEFPSSSDSQDLEASLEDACGL